MQGDTDESAGGGIVRRREAARWETEEGMALGRKLLKHVRDWRVRWKKNTAGLEPIEEEHELNAE